MGVFSYIWVSFHCIGLFSLYRSLSIHMGLFYGSLFLVSFHYIGLYPYIWVSFMGLFPCI